MQAMCTVAAGATLQVQVLRAVAAVYRPVQAIQSLMPREIQSLMPRASRARLMMPLSQLSGHFAAVPCPGQLGKQMGGSIYNLSSSGSVFTTHDPARCILNPVS